MIKPIKTSLGEFHYRDAIYLDNEKYNTKTNELKLIGEINGDLCTEKVSDKFIYYEIIFHSVTEWVKIELDKYLVSDRPNFHETSSFYKICNDGIYLYVFHTYDWVYEIKCKNFEISFGDYT
ncbi:MAG: hypothetical protein HRU38_25215 [Saccharospirillaceae bacterium]|nr:hypothetical protein [Saccharospirillaceae bacterium]